MQKVTCSQVAVFKGYGYFSLSPLKKVTHYLCITFLLPFERSLESLYIQWLILDFGNPLPLLPFSEPPSDSESTPRNMRTRARHTHTSVNAWEQFGNKNRQNREIASI
jgi:hypothetical protein